MHAQISKPKIPKFYFTMYPVTAQDAASGDNLWSDLNWKW